MYTILINDDNSLSTSIRERIMHRSSMVDKMHFLANPIYKNEHNMRDFTCIMEYRLPISEKYVAEILTVSDELYKGKLEYLLPINTKITSEAGDISIKLTFTFLDMDADGNKIERVRKTSSVQLTVIPVEQWSDYIADTDLDAIAQVMLGFQSKLEQEKAYAEMVYETKADSIKLDKDTNEIYVTANGKKIGDTISVNELGDELADQTEDGLIKVLI